MGIFDFLKTTKSQYKGFSDDGRQLGADATKLRGELNHAKHDYEMALARLEYEKRKLELENSISELKADAEEFIEDYPEESEGSEDKILAAVLGSLINKNQPAPTISAPTAAAPTPGDPTDQELRTLWQKLPQPYKDQAMGEIKK
jgi:hypothetical protein